MLNYQIFKYLCTKSFYFIFPKKLTLIYSPYPGRLIEEGFLAPSKKQYQRVATSRTNTTSVLSLQSPLFPQSQLPPPIHHLCFLPSLCRVILHNTFSGFWLTNHKTYLLLLIDKIWTLTRSSLINRQFNQDEVYTPIISPVVSQVEIMVDNTKDRGRVGDKTQLKY